MSVLHVGSVLPSKIECFYVLFHNILWNDLEVLKIDSMKAVQDHSKRLCK